MSIIEQIGCWNTGHKIKTIGYIFPVTISTTNSRNLRKIAISNYEPYGYKITDSFLFEWASIMHQSEKITLLLVYSTDVFLSCMVLWYFDTQLQNKTNKKIYQIIGMSMMCVLSECKFVINVREWICMVRWCFCVAATFNNITHSSPPQLHSNRLCSNRHKANG